jgi:hypothetical protein
MWGKARIQASVAGVAEGVPGPCVSIALGVPNPFVCADAVVRRHLSPILIRGFRDLFECIDR